MTYLAVNVLVYRKSLRTNVQILKEVELASAAGRALPCNALLSIVELSGRNLNNSLTRYIT